MRPISATVLALLPLLALGCKSSSAPAAGTDADSGTSAERSYLIERIGDTQIAQLYADGFDELSLRDKQLCYHLSRAAIAGRDIFIDQKFAYNLRIRDLFEELYMHRDAMQAEDAEAIADFLKLFWVHNGIHHVNTTRRLALSIDQQRFLAAAEQARAAGAELPPADGIQAVYQIITDPEIFVSVTNKSPEGGVDPLLASCNNLYVGVSMQDLEGFQEQNGLNSRLVRSADGTLSEEIYRAGDPERGIPAGLYAAQLEAIIAELDKACEFAPEATVKALRALIKFYRSGSLEDWRAYDIAWVDDDSSVVDTINGFIEVYLDARGVKGAFEAVVSFTDPEMSKDIARLAAEAQWFEDRMPWEDEFKKAEVKGINARVISVVTETGDAGPTTPIGINLPNDSWVRQNHGSKSVNLHNVVESYARLRGSKSLEEFAWDDAEVARAKQYQGIDDVHTNLHEVVGHASGQIRPEIKNPAQILGTYYSTLEEARADLVGLYFVADPKMQEIGMVEDPEAALAQYEGYCRNILVQLRRVPLGGRIEQDHMRNRQMVVFWLIANTDAVKVEQRDGKTYYRVTSAAAFQQGCGELLAEVMRIKATGDFKAGKALVDSYGTKVDPALHREVLGRLESLNLASVTGFVQPELHEVRNAEGEVTDIELSYPMAIDKQMLGWSGRL